MSPKKSAGVNHVVGWTVLRPGARHERHLHRNCDEFFIVQPCGVSFRHVWT
jgi:mannose-6-phosphate isomerase-like protein (cupin superfamily)